MSKWLQQFSVFALALVGGAQFAVGSGVAKPICYGNNELDGMLVDFPGVMIDEDCSFKGVFGYILVQWDLTDDGEPTNIQLLNSSGSCVDGAVIQAVSKRRYGHVDECPGDAPRTALQLKMTVDGRERDK